MAREKGTGSLQREKSGRWTLRVSINGKRISRSTRTTDRSKAEAFLERFLAPLGLGTLKIPLADAWRQYEMSPNRPDVAASTLKTKRQVWMAYARWMERNHVEISQLSEVTEMSVAEYLAQLRCRCSASTYNANVCVLRAMFHTLAERIGLDHDPWAGVCLRADDSISRRELTLDEVNRAYEAAGKAGGEWKLLFAVGIYTGLRLGDCCLLKWSAVDLKRQIIQLVPEKTKKHLHGQPITVPIHPVLLAELERQKASAADGPGAVYVNPKVAEDYLQHHWRIDDRLRRIFTAANIAMSIRVEGRRRRTAIASFHSLRHTFVSFAANSGVPLPVVQSIVGHTSTTMTRHYYHENEEALRAAVAAIPVVGGAAAAYCGEASTAVSTTAVAPQGGSQPPRRRAESIPARLKKLDALFGKGLITEEEFKVHRARILAEV